MRKKRFSPYFVILIGFFALILVGFCLLLLPISTTDGIKPEDALFVSASAVCITGLSPVTLSETFTGFGQAVIALLVQVGGLGFVTIAMTAIAILGMKLGISNKLLLDETLGTGGRLDYRRFLFRAVLITFISETIGFILNLIALRNDFSGGELVWVSLFHSISAFNNAGLDIFGGSGMTLYSSNVLLLINTSLLTIVGGLGFIVFNDVFCARRWKRFSVHTKIVLVMTPILLLAGTLVFYFSEWGKIDFLNAFFMSAMSRTCGFSTQDLSGWNNASLCFLNLLMFIGAGPVSTGGGIKCTTCFVIFAALFAMLRGRHTIAFHRHVPHRAVIYAMFVTIVALIYAFVTGTILCAAEPEISMAFLFTETVSALANVGFSAGVTPLLGVAGKLVLTVAMFMGRVGFMTVLLVFGKKRKETGVRYIDADIITG